jgi:hypothetical protein
MDNTTIHFDLYSLLMEVAHEECELIGIKLINEGGSYFIGVSWLVKAELNFRSFNKLTMMLLVELYLPKIISIQPHWQEQLNHWAKQPITILSLGKLGCG